MTIEEQFNKTKPTIALYAKRFSKATNIPVEEYESAMWEEFGKKAERYDGRVSFSAYIKPILNQCSQRVASRREKKFYSNVVHAEGISDEDGNPSFEFESEINVEIEAIESLEPTKKCEDKRQLIHALLESADEITTAIVNRMLENPDASRNSIAAELGIHHEIVTRRLKRLAKHYDQARFGEISQYLAS